MGDIVKHLKTVLLWVLALFIALVMIQQGFAKFSPDGRWARSFATWGYPVWFRVLVGAIETGGGALLLVPPLATYAAVALVTIMLGAAGTLLLDGRVVDAATPVAYGVVLLWIAWERRAQRVRHRPRAP